MRQAFNEELDGMFKDANLPETEAWAVMTQDLREAKAARNDLKRENVLVFCMSLRLFVVEAILGLSSESWKRLRYRKKSEFFSCLDAPTLTLSKVG